jgi:hypothetical protein
MRLVPATIDDVPRLDVLATDAAGVLGLHRLEAETYGFNTAAIRAFTRAGFVHEGTRRAAYDRNGGRTASASACSPTTNRSPHEYPHRSHRAARCRP